MADDGQKELLASEGYKDMSDGGHHPLPGRRRVYVPRRDEAYGIKSETAAEVKYRRYPDEAVSAALQIAQNAEEQMQRLIDQRMKITAVNIGFVGAVLLYVFGKDFPDNDLSLARAIAAMIILPVLSISFGIFSKQLGSAEVYYFALNDSCRELVERHYGFRHVHWIADSAYRRELGLPVLEVRSNELDEKRLGKFKRIFDVHSYQSTFLINVCVPVAGFFAVLIAITL